MFEKFQGIVVNYSLNSLSKCLKGALKCQVQDEKSKVVFNDYLIDVILRLGKVGQTIVNCIQ